MKISRLRGKPTTDTPIMPCKIPSSSSLGDEASKKISPLGFEYVTRVDTFFKGWFIEVIIALNTFQNFES
jgi:hypothetical protein